MNSDKVFHFCHLVEGEVSDWPEKEGRGGYRNGIMWMDEGEMVGLSMEWRGRKSLDWGRGSRWEGGQAKKCLLCWVKICESLLVGKRSN
jgi:hypothetical protein